MNHLEGKLGIREYIAILILIVGTRVTDDTPVLITTKAQNAGWMVPLFSGILAFVTILFMIKVFSVHKEKELNQILKYLFGKWGGLFISLILLIIGVGVVTTESAIYTNIIGTMYFPKTPRIILYALLMGVCGYSAKRGLSHIGSVSWMVLFYIKIAFIIVLVITLAEGVHFYMFPLLGPGPGEIAWQSISNVAIYVDFLMIGFMLPHLKSFKDFRKGTKIALFFVMIEISLGILSFILLFDYISVAKLNYPFHESIRYIRIGFLTNVETFFFPFWLMASFLKFSFYLYLISYLYSQIFRIKQFENLIPIIALIILFLGMIPETPTFTIFGIKEKLFTIISPLFFILPILMWVMVKIKGDFRNENKQESH